MIVRIKEKHSNYWNSLTRKQEYKKKESHWPYAKREKAIYNNIFYYKGDMSIEKGEEIYIINKNNFIKKLNI